MDIRRHGPPEAGGTACAIEYLEHAEKTIGRLPEEIVADAGYDSEQNHRFLDERGVTAYVKHNESFREMKNGRWREDPMRSAN